MKLSFVKVNPLENMTILILDNVSPSEHQKIANRLMNYNNLQAEQVGFVQRPENSQGKGRATRRLQMMGGEFCANATRSLAAYLVFSEHPAMEKKGNIYRVFLEVSGCKERILCEVNKTEEPHVFISKIEMPPPSKVSREEIYFMEGKIPLTRVDFPGIVHFILDEKEILDRDKFFLHLKKKMSTEKVQAFGLMFYDKEKDFLKPLVYVKATDSLFWERSCASGSAALGLAQVLKEGYPLVKTVDQPGGKLTVSVNKNSHGWEIYLEGRVEIVAQGTVYL